MIPVAKHEGKFFGFVESVAQAEALGLTVLPHETEESEEAPAVVERSAFLLPVAKEEGGEFFGYADEDQIEAHGLFVVEDPDPVAQAPEAGEAAPESDPEPEAPPKRRRRQPRRHPSSKDAE